MSTHSGDVYVAYARISRATDGSILTNERQFRDLDRFAGKENLPIVARFSDTQSAWKLDKPRDGWDSTVTFIKDHPNAHVLTVHTDRMFRNHVDLNAIEELASNRGRNGKLLIKGPHQQYDLADPTVQSMIRFRTEMARQEVASLSRRLRDYINDERLRGIPGRVRRAFGFRFVPGEISPRTGRRLLKREVDPGQGEVAREVAQRFIDGEKWVDISRDLDARADAAEHAGDTELARGLRSAEGNPWHDGHLRKAMSNPNLGGFVSWRIENEDGELVDTLIEMAKPDGHPDDVPWPILKREVFDELQRQINAARRGPRPRKTPTLLTSKAVHRPCNVIMMGSWAERPLTPAVVDRYGLDSNVRYIYRCPPSRGGCGATVTACFVDDIVLSAVKEWVDRNGGQLDATTVIPDEELERAYRELEAAEEAFTEARIKAAESLRSRARMARWLEATQATLDRWNARVAELEDPARRREHLDTVLDAQWAENPKRRRKVVDYVVIDVSIDRFPGGFRRFDPSRVRLTLR